MTNAMIPTATVYDENNPAPFINALIVAAFDQHRFTVTAIERDDETTTVYANDRDGRSFMFDFEATSDDDAMYFTSPDIDPLTITVSLDF